MDDQVEPVEGIGEAVHGVEEEVNQNIPPIDQQAVPAVATAVPPTPGMAEMFQQMAAAMTEAFRGQARAPT